MPITIQEVAVYLALVKKYLDREKRDFTLKVDWYGNILAFAVDDKRTKFDSYSSVINILQNNRDDFGDMNTYFLASSTAPTERDLGMGRMTMPLRNIYYFKPTKGIFSYWRSGTGFEEWVAAGLPAFDRYNKTGLYEISSIDTGDPYLKAYNWAFGAGFTSDEVLKYSKKFEGYNLYINARSSFQNPETPTYTYFNRKITQISIPGNFVAVSGGRVDSGLRHEIFMKLAWAIVGEGSTVRKNSGGPAPNLPRGHNIGSVLRGPKDEILWWGVNTNKEHFTLHGEVNLIQTFQNTLAEDGAEIGRGVATKDKPILYSTLEPCYMCAGMILESGVNLSCKYGQDDSGIINNVLKQNNSQQELNTSFGRMVDVASSFVRNPKGKFGVSSRGDRPIAVTGFLNKTINILFLNAINAYINVVPQSVAEKKSWEKSADKVIWENGLRLLKHINPSVKQKWKRRTDRHYSVTGVDDLM